MKPDEGSTGVERGRDDLYKQSSINSGWKNDYRLVDKIAIKVSETEPVSMEAVDEVLDCVKYAALIAALKDMNEYKIQAYEQLKVIDDLRAALKEFIEIGDELCGYELFNERYEYTAPRLKSAIERAKAIGTSSKEV